MKKQSKHIPDTARIFTDQVGIYCCECPKCETFKAPVQVNEKVTCEKCKYEYKAVE